MLKCTHKCEVFEEKHSPSEIFWVHISSTCHSHEDQQSEQTPEWHSEFILKVDILFEKSESSSDKEFDSTALNHLYKNRFIHYISELKE